jgi:hypothetical protein
LIENNYEFKRTTEVIKGNYIYPNDAIAEFEKSISFSDIDGNWINDNSIEVSIKFPKKADINGDDLYVGKISEFIN